MHYINGQTTNRPAARPPGDPGDGADGGDVVLVCDPGCDSLLHLHGRTTYTAPSGANANPSTGSSGPKRNKDVRARGG